MLNLIVAVAEESRVIGTDGGTPWDLRADEKNTHAFRFIVMRRRSTG